MLFEVGVDVSTIWAAASDGGLFWLRECRLRKPLVDTVAPLGCRECPEQDSGLRKAREQR
jgi:hypothetical protein